MSTSSFHFDESAFRRIAEEAVVDIAAQQTRDLDDLRQRLAGQPVEVIKPELQQLFASYEGHIADPKLSEWAQLLSDNTRIEMRPEAVDWDGAR